MRQLVAYACASGFLQSRASMLPQALLFLLSFPLVEPDDTNHVRTCAYVTT